MQALRLRKLKADRLFKKIIDKIRLLSHKDRESYLLLYSILGYVPGDIRLYEMAMSKRAEEYSLSLTKDLSSLAMQC